MMAWEPIHERARRHIIDFQTVPDIVAQGPNAHRALLRRLSVIHAFQYLKGHVPTDLSSLLPTAWVTSGVMSDFTEYWPERDPVDHNRCQVAFWTHLCRVGSRPHQKNIPLLNMMTHHVYMIIFNT